MQVLYLCTLSEVLDPRGWLLSGKALGRGGTQVSQKRETEENRGINELEMGIVCTVFALVK